MGNLIENLIDETLKYNRRSSVGCFVVNMASQELREHGEIALSKIEEVIRNRLVNESNLCVDHDELVNKQPGLLNLWMAYFLIAANGDLPRIVLFLRSLDGPILATAILAMNPTWPDENEKAMMPTLLIEFVRAIANTRSGCVAEVARYYLP